MALPTHARRSTRPRQLAAIACAALLVPLTLSTPDAEASPSPAAAGWTLEWSADFTGPAGTLPSSQKWIFDLGHSYPGGPANWGTGEIQTYTKDPSNISLDGAGHLRITPRRDAAGNWTSARIETRRANFRPPQGGVLAIEGRIRMPDVTGAAALGYWPAFWALGAPYRGNYWNWPGIGEFDIMENVNGINRVWSVLHCGVSPGGPCNEATGLGASRPCPGTPCQASFHTYRFEWDTSTAPHELRWYVDGRNYHTISQADLPVGTWNQLTSHGYFILLNVAMGGAFPDGVAGFATPTTSTEPGHSMLVDYVKVWTSGGGTDQNDPPTDPSAGDSAYATLQAERFAAAHGLRVGSGSGAVGEYIGWLSNGDWARYENVDFGGDPATQFVARVASGASPGVSGLVQVRLDSPTSAPVGSFAIANTGGWSAWRTVPANIDGVTGVHDVYLTFSSGQGADYVNVDWFTFAH